MVLSISQSPEDFIQSKASTAILVNSYVKYILKLQKGHEVLGRFDLNENEIKAVRELEVRQGEYSEVFVKFFNRSVVARLEPSALEYWMATTAPEDTAFLERERLRHSGVSELELLNILSRQYPRGIAGQKKEESHAESGR